MCHQPYEWQGGSRHLRPLPSGCHTELCNCPRMALQCPKPAGQVGVVGPSSCSTPLLWLPTRIAAGDQSTFCPSSERDLVQWEVGAVHPGEAQGLGECALHGAAPEVRGLERPHLPVWEVRSPDTPPRPRCLLGTALHICGVLGMRVRAHCADSGQL